MKIKLLASDAYSIAIAILNGELPPETNNMDVIEELCELARIRGIELSFCRQDKNREVCFSVTEAEIAIERRIAMRPIPTDD
ncbi:hypothetical protein [Nostoc sp.]